MKFTFKGMPADFRLQVAYRPFKDMEGGTISIYYADGGRYEHIAASYCTIDGVGFNVYKDVMEELLGSIEVEGETDEEKKIFNHPFTSYYERDKESDYFHFVKCLLLESKDGFQYERNGDWGKYKTN